MRRILQYLYSDVYDKSKNRSMISGKSYEEYEQKMLKDRPFKVVLKYKKTIERFYHRVELKFKEEEEIKDDTDIMELIKKLDSNADDCEIDIRFTREGCKDFSFDRMKNFNDEAKKFSKKETENVTVTLEQCFSVFEEKEKLEPGN